MLCPDGSRQSTRVQFTITYGMHGFDSLVGRVLVNWVGALFSSLLNKVVWRGWGRVGVRLAMISVGILRIVGVLLLGLVGCIGFLGLGSVGVGWGFRSGSVSMGYHSGWVFIPLGLRCTAFVLGYW